MSPDTPGAVAFVDEDISQVDHSWRCTQDHRARIAAKGLEWIESELFKRALRELPLPPP